MQSYMKLEAKLRPFNTRKYEQPLNVRSDTLTSVGAS